MCIAIVKPRGVSLAEDRLRLCFSNNPDGAGFAIAVNKGNKALLDSLNQGLAAIKADGSYQKLYDKYFTK